MALFAIGGAADTATFNDGPDNDLFYAYADFGGTILAVTISLLSSKA